MKILILLILITLPYNNIEIRQATAETTNYIEFLDGSGGWVLDDKKLTEGQQIIVTIDNKGTVELEDDEIIYIEEFTR